MEFVCSCCMYKSFQKNDILRHFEKKNSCGEGIKTIIEIDSFATCESCGKTFTNKHNLQRHIKNSCKIAPLEKELINLKKSVNKSVNSATNTTNTTSATKVNNTKVNDSLNIFSYDYTSLDKISDADYNDVIINSNDIYDAIPKLIKKIHFNPEIPENHNIYISNMSKYNKYINLFRDGQWVVEDKILEIDYMMNEKENNLSIWAKTKGDKYPEAINKMKKYILQRHDRDNIKIMTDEIEKILYNNRNMVKSRRAQHSFTNNQ